MTNNEFEDIVKMFHGCRYCGAANIWPYGKASWRHSCRECYRADDWEELYDWRKLHRSKPESKYRRIMSLEWEKVEREYYRKKRKENNVVEAIIECSSCGEEKPLFEFKWHYLNQIRKKSDLNRWYCSACISSMNDTKRCPRCGKNKEEEDFEDGTYIYSACIDCREEINKRKERWLTVVADSACIAALKYRKMEINDSNMNMIRELLLAKRINKEAKTVIYKQFQEKRRVQNESNSTNV